MEFLTDYFNEKYGKPGLDFPEPGEDEDVWESSVVNPERFLGFLPYVKQRKTGLGWIVG